MSGVTQDWVVKAVREGKVEPNRKGAGELQKYYVDFVGADGTAKSDTYWRRKAGDKPEVGRSYYGCITEGNYGPMFKKEAPGGTPRQGGGRSSGPPDPGREARIVRQHSQEMAIRVLTAMDAFSSARDVAGVNRLRGQLSQWTDFFDEDVMLTGEASSVGRGGESKPPSLAGSSPPAPLKRPVDEQAEIEAALDAAGVTATGVRLLLANYMLEKLPADRREKAVRNLKMSADTETQFATVRALTDAAEQHYGEALTKLAQAEEDDIPF